MRKKLALNRHWYDVLLDYSPIALKIDLDIAYFKHEFIESLKEVNLSQLMHLKFVNIRIEVEMIERNDSRYNKERLDVLFD